jgi:hypothetical protein
MGRKSKSTLTVRLLEQRRDELLEELRVLAPDLVEKLVQAMEALKEQRPERGEYEGLARAAVIRKYLLKVGRPSELREIRDAVAAPASRFDGRSIWDGGKREVEQGRMMNIADHLKGEDWVLSLPEWERNGTRNLVQGTRPRSVPSTLRGGRRRVLLAIADHQ